MFRGEHMAGRVVHKGWRKEMQSEIYRSQELESNTECVSVGGLWVPYFPCKSHQSKNA